MNNFGQRIQFKLIIHLFCEGKTELDYLQKFIRQRNKNTLVRLNKILINPNPLTLAQKSVEEFDNLKMEILKCGWYLIAMVEIRKLRKLWII